ncbi:hypothetical protein T492DRAFT_1089714 [Pavlovales sp. CCMP2436]|nr:hypothetical protein T492DRAFT_1089714 [Pavlovales sp. CCMP2436]|mmetsp:Transcript_35894/g.83175  ORF Transcript_35894/g.83175 Transcript_35894/m.83175 type:complete len:400 (+) Transcript_35894:1-1200(+)
MAGRREIALKGAGYVVSSSLMLVVNKAALRAFPFPGSLAVLQYAASALVVRSLAAAGLVEAEPLRWSRVRQFWTVTLVFSLTIFVNMHVLQRTNVETVVVFRSNVPVLTALCDFLFLGMELPSARSWAALLTIIVGSLVYVEHASHVDANTLQIALTYVALIAFEMVYVKHVMNTVEMSTFTRVLYNNSLSCAFGTAIALLTGEGGRLARARRVDISIEALSSTGALLLLSCAFGLSISFFGFGFRSAVSATTFTVVGVMCKVFSVGTSLLLLHARWSARGVLGLTLCLAGGACYKQAPKRADLRLSLRRSGPGETDELLERGPEISTGPARSGHDCAGHEKALGVPSDVAWQLRAHGRAEPAEAPRRAAQAPQQRAHRPAPAPVMVNPAASVCVKTKN